MARRLGLGLLALGAGLMPAGLALAQQDFSTGLVVPSGEQGVPLAVVVLDRERLFTDSLMGKAVLARLEAATRDLEAENRRLEAALEAEERDLTERRAVMPAADFRALAQEFDSRVEELRQAQEGKGRALTRERDLEQQRFFEAALPVLATLMREAGAVAILDQSAVILRFDRVDITAQAIARLDAELGDGSALPQPVPKIGPDADPAPQPGPAPAGDTGPAAAPGTTPETTPAPQPAAPQPASPLPASPQPASP